MSTEHVVVPTEECDIDPIQAVKCKYGLRFGDCVGCLGDGRRALLDQAVPVEPVQCVPAYGGSGFYAWKPVES